MLSSIFGTAFKAIGDSVGADSADKPIDLKAKGDRFWNWVFNGPK